MAARSLAPRGQAGKLSEKVRVIARCFQKSPMLNDELQSFVPQAGVNGRRELVMDVRTRWNSTTRMLRNFLHLSPALKLYYASKSEAFPLSADELQSLEDLLTTLAIVEEASERLQLGDLTIKQADMALQVR